MTVVARPVAVTARASGPPPAPHDVDWHAARGRAHGLGGDVAASHGGGTATVPVTAGAGRVLAADVEALDDLPSRDRSAMDGYAWSLVAPPHPGAPGLVLAGSPVLAGDLPDDVPLAPGTARPVATGGVLPPGTTAVLRREHGAVVDGRLHALSSELAPRPGEHVRRAGEEARRGDVLVRAGQVLTPARLGLVAAAGHDLVEVVPRVPVDLLVLGDEVVPAGRPTAGLVRDALGPSVPALLDACGADVAPVVGVPDGPGALRSALGATTAPVVVTTGSTAHGPADHLRPTLGALGASCLVDGVAVRPGHPVSLWRLRDGRALLALPGNPLAALTCLVALAPPLLAGLLGTPVPVLATATAAVPLAGRPGTTRLVPCTADDDGVRPVPWQGSAMLRGLADADVLAVVPGQGTPPGGRVEVLPRLW